MKRSIWHWELLGFSVTALGGTLLHYLYDWLSEAWWIAPFSGVNESTWEHMKLLFWPMLLFAAAQSLFFRDLQDFWCIKLKGTLLGLTLIPVLFYTYNGVVGRSPDWLNITIFFVSAAIAYLCETKLAERGIVNCPHPKAAMAVLYLIGILFGVFTFLTPEIGVFRDPLTGMYGIERSRWEFPSALFV